MGGSLSTLHWPQLSWAKVVFSQACVKNSVHGGEGVCLSACWDTPPGPGRSSGTRPPKEQTPQTRQTPPPDQADTPGADTAPWEQTPLPVVADTPLGADPPGSRPPQTRQTPREADCSIRSTSGRYASYWNAFLFFNIFSNIKFVLKNKVLVVDFDVLKFKKSCHDFDLCIGWTSNTHTCFGLLVTSALGFRVKVDPLTSVTS